MPSLLSRIGSTERGYRPILLLTIGGLPYLIGNAVVWFFLPILAEGLFKNIFIVGLLMAISSVIAMFFDIPFGGLSDHLGRKRIFINGLILMALLGLMLPMVNDIWTFVAFMVLFGFGNLSIVVPIRAYVMDVAPKEKTSEFFGIFEMITQVGLAVGSALAGYLVADRIDLGASNTGLFYFLASLASAIILLTIKESVADMKTFSASIRAAIEKDKVYIKSLRDFKDLRYSGVAILLTTFIIVFVDGLVWTLEPLYTTLGIDAETAGWILVMFIIPFILFEVPAGLLADRIGKVKMFITGLLIAGIFLIAFGSTNEPTMLMVFAFMATSGLALARPAMDGFLTDISAGKERGGITGVWNVAEDTAYVVSPILGGAVAEVYGLGSAFLLMGGLLIVTIPLVYSAIKKN